MNKSQSTGIWIVVVLLILCLGSMLFPGQTTSTKDISYSQFLTKVKSGQIESVQIDKDTLIAKPKAGQAESVTTVMNSKKPVPVQYRVMIPMNDLSLYQKLEEKSVDVNVKKPSDSSQFIGLLSIVLPFLLIIGFVILMAKTLQSGGSQAMSFGKSKAKLMLDSKVKVTFKDVAGIDEEKQELEEIVDFLKNGEKYIKLGAKIPKGVLLVGVPGTGKTLMAKAVAGEAGVPFFSISGSDFVEMFVGVGASRVRDLFKQAKEKSPAIIFIDEIDAIGRARGKNAMTGSNDERENTLNQLLTEMDGFQTDTNVIVLAATNRADILDKALLRAGRFDRQIYVDLPDLNEREAIFKVHLKPLKLAKNLDISFLARQTPGFSGADIANVCNEAALIAARRNKDAVDKEDFLSAVDRIVGGLEKRTRIISPAEKRAIAFHEAGHATVSWLVEHAAPLVKVTIVPRGQSLGAAWYLPEERQITTAEQIKDEMCATLGGRAAEKIIFDKISTGALSDLEKVSRQATAMVTIYGLNDKLGNITYYDSTGQRDYGFTKPYSEKTAQVIDEEISKLIEEQYERAIEILSANRDKLTRLAEILLEKEVIFKEDLVEIFGPRPFGDDENTAPAAPADDTKEGDASESNGADDTSSDTGDANGGERPSDTKAVV